MLAERFFRPSKAGWAKGSRPKESGVVELLAFPGFCTKAREACNCTIRFPIATAELVSCELPSHPTDGNPVCAPRKAKRSLKPLRP